MSPSQPTSVSKRSLLFWAAVVAIAIGLLIHLSYYFPRTVDDLFISLRYAERFISGHGLTYNAGHPVEGYSNFTWVLGQSIALALGLEGVLATKLMGIASVLALFGATYYFARNRFDSTDFIALCTPLMLAASAYVVSWSTWGLETPLFLALLFGLPLVLTDCMRASGWRRWLMTALFVVLFAGTRPEAGLYVLTVGLAAVANDIGRDADVAELKRRLRSILPAAGIAAALTAVLLLARKAYYGLWLPHTYYAKQGSGFELEKLSVLWTDGAAASEIVFVAGGLLAVSVMAVWRRKFVLLAICASCAFFVASVEVDWMPNQRHLLPLYIACMLGWTWVLTESWTMRRQRVAATSLALLVLSVVLAWGIHAATTDVRFSSKDVRFHGGGEQWIRPKNEQRWTDAWTSIRGDIPQSARDKYLTSPGMISQLFYLVEASAAAESDSWYVGRDIGRVGYYSPVQVFDTPGLFTPDAVYRAERVPLSAEKAAFDRFVVAAELLEGWSVPPSKRAEYIVEGSRARIRDTQRPSPRQLRDRYARIAQKFPHTFTMATLYGESVGGIVAKKASHVRSTLEPPVFRASAPEGLEGPSVTLARGRFELAGCSLAAKRVARGGSIRTACFWSTPRRASGPSNVFVHIEQIDGHGRFQADHELVGGYLPPARWPAGKLASDRFTIDVPDDAIPGTYRVWLGLWDERGRATVDDTRKADDEHRIRGPTLDVTR